MSNTSKKLQRENAFEAYSAALKAKYKFKESREHAYRPALQNFIESYGKNIDAINDAARIKCGAPDFIVYNDRIPVGYIEAKDIDKDLSKEERSEQIRAYHSLGNLILTDYLEFRWFVDGELRLKISIGETKGSNIIFSENAENELNNLFSNFIAAEVKTIQSAVELAERLAITTTSIRDLIIRAFEVEESGAAWLNRWLKAFSEVLIADLKKETFADMFAQTLTYGFFAARVHHKSDLDFSRFSAAKILPKTNPFLRKLFAQFAGADMPETINWAVDEVVELLKRANMTEILKDFGKNTGKEDPVVHFYETFLTCYDPKLRETRGVYYTPTPVVDFIVRSVDQILIKDFEKPKGLADDKTLILDPAVGTGSFLHQVVEKIHSRFNQNKGAWDSYVTDNLLDRIFGFEILMAPYSVAHLKLGLQLQETGYKFEKDRRLGVYLTNTLEASAKKSQELLFEWVSEEANAASDLKKGKPIMVVLGNPPYSGHSENKGKWINELLKGYDGITGQKTDSYFTCDGKPLGEKNSKWLNDDYVKFIRFAQWRIKQTGHGVLGFITNHGFLENPTFRGMRQSLIESFDELYLLDLHGNSKKKEKCPDGSKDENVFDIQQGVSVCFFVRSPGAHQRKAKVFRADLFGTRELKYDWLNSNSIETIEWKSVDATTPFYLFSAGQDKKLQKEFNTFWKLTDIFPINVLGFQTHRDHFAITHTKKEMTDRLIDLRDKKLTDHELKEKYEVKDNRDWQIAKSRRAIQSNDGWKKNIVECLYRPYDTKFCYLDYVTMDYPRRELLDHVLHKDNLCILASRQQATTGFRHAWITRLPAESCAISTKTKEQNYVFPLFVYPSSPLEEAAFGKPNKEINIHPDLIRQLESQWNVQLKVARSDKSTFTPQDVSFYIYAVLNSPDFKEKYNEMLKTDFPRLPFPKDMALFLGLAQKGEELAKIHMMELCDEAAAIDFPIKGTNKVEKITYESKEKRIFINKNQYFSGISAELWEHKVGGYDILSKWLKSRPNSELAYEDIKKFKMIVWSCVQTNRIGSDIDKLVFKHGGWVNQAIAKSERHSQNKNVLNTEKEQISTPAKKGFGHVVELRLALAAKIVDSLLDTKEFSRVKFAKAFYLADVISGVDLKTEYTREAAGPLDQRSLYNEKIGIEPLAAQRGFFDAEKKAGKEFDYVQYASGPNLSVGMDSYEKLYGKSADKIEALIKLIRPMTRDQIEIIATLYACWNDMLLSKKSPTDKDLVREFKDKWHPEKSKKFISVKNKKARFTEKQLIDAIAWMKNKGLVPNGSGKKTKSKPTKEDYIPF